MDDKDQALVKRFLALFAGLDRAHGVYEVAAPATPGQKQGGRAYTVMEPVTFELWEKHLAGEQGLGVVPIRDDGTVRWGAIDLDVPTIDHVQLEKICHQFGLPVAVCRSKSGGAHVFLFTKEDAPAELVRAKLTSWAGQLGYPNAEVFPKQTALASNRDVGNWLNMPYFGGERTTRYAIRSGKSLDWRQFPTFAAAKAVTVAELSAHALPASAAATAGGDFEEGPPCLQALAGQTMGEGMRNSLLFNMGVYARLRYGDDEWSPFLTHFNESFMSPPLPGGEVRGLIKSVNKKDYFFTCAQPPINGACQRKTCRARKYGIGALIDTPDFAVDSIQKIMTDPVTWVVAFATHRVEVTTGELLSQVKFREVCLEKLSFIPKMLKQDTWDKMIRPKAAEAEIVLVPEDASREGQLMHHVDAFCTGRAQARAKDELLQGKPWSEDGRTYFRAADLMRHLDQQHFRELKQRELWLALTRRDVGSHMFDLKGKRTRCWSLPDFQRQTEEYDVPRKTVEEF